ncbi:MAG: UDP-N-acetylmuramate dehydrogenase, partial [Deltaproteobacteria bacterium]|nr:UDP-N-acetylmuramate dehydrogenase [Deltaproteobacteria bacterium]
MEKLTEEMKQQIKQVCGTVLFDEPLSRYTTIRVGGPADGLVYPKTIEELSQLVSWSRRHKVPL